MCLQLTIMAVIMAFPVILFKSFLSIDLSDVKQLLVLAYYNSQIIVLLRESPCEFKISKKYIVTIK